jgi:hypothetical protein
MNHELQTIYKLHNPKMMKKLIFTCLILLFTLPTFAQVKFGFRAGLGTTDISPNELTLLSADGREALGLAIDNANFSIFGGFLVRFEIDDFFIQPELMFSSNGVDYKVDDFTNVGETITTIRTENYQYLDIPIMVGYKAGGFLRLMLGVEGHVFLNSTSDLFDFENYDQSFESLTLGWQGGIGIDISKFMLDLRYQGNFSKFGSHIRFADQEYEFDESPSRLLLSLGFLF